MRLAMTAAVGVVGVLAWVATAASAQCPDPCKQYTGEQRGACCRYHDNEGPICGHPCPPTTCGGKFSPYYKSNPQIYGLDMQHCCSASASQHDITCSGFPVIGNESPCGYPCAPPTLAAWVNGTLQPATGWGKGTVIKIYIDPALNNHWWSSSGFPNTQGAALAIEDEINQVAGQLGYTAQHVATPSAAAYSILSDSGSNCPTTAAACTAHLPGAGATTAATTYFEFANWSSDLDAAPLSEIQYIERHEFLHTAGIADDSEDNPSSCSGQTGAWFATPAWGQLSPPPPTLDRVDLCGATRGAVGANTAGSGGGGSGGGGVPAPIRRPAARPSRIARVLVTRLPAPGTVNAQDCHPTVASARRIATAPPGVAARPRPSFAQAPTRTAGSAAPGPAITRPANTSASAEPATARTPPSASARPNATPTCINYSANSGRTRDALRRGRCCTAQVRPV